MDACGGGRGRSSSPVGAGEAVHHDVVAGSERPLHEVKQRRIESTHPFAAVHSLRAPPVRDGKAEVRVPRVALEMDATIMKSGVVFCTAGVMTDGWRRVCVWLGCLLLTQRKKEEQKKSSTVRDGVVYVCARVQRECERFSPRDNFPYLYPGS